MQKENKPSPNSFSAKWKLLKSQKELYLMSLPFLILVVVFSYLPIWGWSMAFQKYRPGRSFFEQEWVGFDNFVRVFSDDRFFLAIQNTLAMSLMGLVVGFTVPIVFALMLNELLSGWFKRLVQTVSYLPHFVSWVVVAGLVYKMTATGSAPDGSDGGPINQLIGALGGEPVSIMSNPQYFWGIVTAADLWKELGWNTIMYLAAIASIDAGLYESAKIDGANRWQLMRHITLPGLTSITVILLVMAIGRLISIGFEKQLLLGNSLVMDKALVLDWHAYKVGIGSANFSMGTAISVFNSFVSLILLFLANTIMKKRTGESIF